MVCARGYFVESIVYGVIAGLSSIYFTVAVFRKRSSDVVIPRNVVLARRVGLASSLVNLLMSVDPSGAMERYPWVLIPIMRDIWGLLTFLSISRYTVISVQLANYQADDFTYKRNLFRFSTLPVIVLGIMWIVTSIPSYTLNISWLKGIYIVATVSYFIFGWVMTVKVLFVVAASLKERTKLHPRSPSGNHSRSSSQQQDISGSTSKRAQAVQVMLRLIALSIVDLFIITFTFSFTIDYITHPGLLSDKIRQDCEKFSPTKFIFLPIAFLIGMFVYSHFSSSSSKTSSHGHLVKEGKNNSALRVSNQQVDSATSAAPAAVTQPESSNPQDNGQAV